MTDLSAPTRPVLRYHGGKWRLASWVMRFFPPHDVYLEPFGGAASVLLRKPRARGEVYNDLDGDVVNVFRVLQDRAAAAELKRLVEITPFARDEFELSYQATDDPVERARRMLVRSFMGFGSAGMTRTSRTGFRKNSSRSHTLPCQDWASWPAQIPQFVERLRGVVIENKDALRLIADHDRDNALIYADPPYVWHVRSSMRASGSMKHAYRHEMTDADHRNLAEALHRARGAVVISGYACDLYDRELYGGWERHEHGAMADGGRSRTEVVWLNPACSAALRRAATLKEACDA